MQPGQAISLLAVVSSTALIVRLVELNAGMDLSACSPIVEATVCLLRTRLLAHSVSLTFVLRYQALNCRIFFRSWT